MNDAPSVNTPRRASIGIGMHSYSEAWKENSGAKFHDALTFLEYAGSMGASGVQVGMKAEEWRNAPRIRARSEELGLWFEGQFSLPKTESELPQFESNVKAIVAAGGKVARTACLSGRRYETFKTLTEFRTFKDASVKSLTMAEPVLKRNRLKLGVENHKDWLAAEFVELLRQLSSEWVGVCVDLGNNISLLEDPYEVVEKLAPFAITSHLKDMAAQEYADGFLLSEVPLGTGSLDLPRMVKTLRKANPQIRFNLEMITRDPLKIPCLTENYWVTFDQRKASDLASTLAFVKQHRCDNLPQTTGLNATQRLALEDENVRKSVAWAAKSLVGI